MGIDIRATVTCSLGTLISANLSDDYIQGSGLIKTRGSCEISGLISPAVGQVVTFNYTKSGVTRNVPRKLRVLSSFADPFRRTTKVELGCKLTYLADLKDPIKWSALNDPENVDFTQSDTNIVTVPIYASSVAKQCLSELGISATSVPLTNKFSISEFDFSPGYVQVLSDLLVSESYFGYLDFNENLQVFSILGTGSSGPVVSQTNLIDVGPIGVGDLPADTVVVSYSSLELKAPDDQELVCRDAETDEEEELQVFETKWGADIGTATTESCALFAYRRIDDPDLDPVLRTAKFCWLESTEEITQYTLFNVYKDGTIAASFFDDDGKLVDPSAISNPVVERRNLVTKRTTKLRTGSAGVAGAIITARLSTGSFWGNYDVFKETVEDLTYDKFGNETLRVVTTTGDLIFKYGVTSLPTTFTNEDGSVSALEIPSGTGILDRIIVETVTNGDFKKTVTSRYGVWGETIAGQQAVAESAQYFSSIGEVQSYLFQSLTGLYLLDVTIETSATGSRGEQEAPLPEDIINSEFAEDSGDPDNGFSTNSTASLTLVTGTPLATRRIELSMPYAPDDTFQRRTVSTDPLRYCYYSSKSDAESKAKNYGLTQNRLLFGNRNGMNIQVPPEVLPNEPFGAFYLSANGAVTQYRTNGTSWTMDSNGIVSSTDALYWGVAGKTA
jgi:hypothetical protein